MGNLQLFEAAEKPFWKLQWYTEGDVGSVPVLLTMLPDSRDESGEVAAGVPTHLSQRILQEYKEQASFLHWNIAGCRVISNGYLRRLCPHSRLAGCFFETFNSNILNIGVVNQT